MIAPTQIPRYVHTFLLCGHTGECYDHFHIQFFGVDALFLEIHAHADLFAHPQQYEQLLGVPCQSGNRFDDDAVDLAFPAIGYQPIQLVPLFHLGAGQTFIGVDVRKLIFGVLFGVVTVVPYLCCKGMTLIVGIAGYPAVGCQSEPFGCLLLCACDFSNVHVFLLSARGHLAVIRLLARHTIPQ